MAFQMADGTLHIRKRDGTFQILGKGSLFSMKQDPLFKTTIEARTAVFLPYDLLRHPKSREVAPILLYLDISIGEKPLAYVKSVKEMPVDYVPMTGREFNASLDWLFGRGSRTIFCNATGLHRETLRAWVTDNRVPRHIGIFVRTLVMLRDIAVELPKEFEPYDAVDLHADMGELRDKINYG